MKKIMLVFGTRPEAVKMCPLILELKKHPDLVRVTVCVTGQHRTLLDQVLDVFQVRPDHDLNILQEEQSLFQITESILAALPPVLRQESPDLVLVHGDTTTAFAAALASYYLNIPVGHVEAGLRTYDPAAPYPEEFNRCAVDIISRYSFAPTAACRDNLLREGRPPETVFITGNTVIDALRTTVRPDYSHPLLTWAAGNRLLLVTAHRRENLGAPMERMFRAIRRVAEAFPDVRIVYPVHPNPLVRQTAGDILGHSDRIRLTEPMDVMDFHNILARAHFVITDSGGLQEEAPAMGKPVLVMRDTTERPEGVAAGTLRVVGTDEEKIFRSCCELLTSPAAYAAMADSPNPYGDGTASRRIADILLR